MSLSRTNIHLSISRSLSPQTATARVVSCSNKETINLLFISALLYIAKSCFNYGMALWNKQKRNNEEKKKQICVILVIEFMDGTFCYSCARLNGQIRNNKTIIKYERKKQNFGREIEIFWNAILENKFHI